MTESMPFIWSQLLTNRPADVSDQLLADIRSTLESCHASGAITGLYDNRLTITSASRFFLQMLDCGYDELLATTEGSFINLIAPEDRGVFLAGDFKDSRTVHELKLLSPRDGVVCVQYTKSTSVDALGRAVWVIAVTANPDRQSLTLINNTQHSGLWYFDCDREGRISRVVWDESFRRLLGYEQATDFPDKLESWSSCVLESEREKSMKALLGSLADRSGKTHYDLTNRLRRRDGSVRWYRSQSDIIRRPDGTASRVVGIIKDITEEHERLVEQRRADAFHRAYTRLNLCEYFVHLEDGTFASLKTEETPLSPCNAHDCWSELILCYATQFVAAEDRAAVLNLLDPEAIRRRFAAGETEFDADCRIELDGQTRWIRNVVMRTESVSGDLSALVFMRDITAQKTQEEAHRQLKVRNSAMERLIEGVVKLVNRFAVCDLEKNTYEFRSFAGDIPYPPVGRYDDHIRRMAELFNPLAAPGTIDELLAPEHLQEKIAASPDGIWRFEYCTKDETIFKSLTVVPVEQHDGRLAKVLFISQEITEEKLRQRDARRALEDACNAARAASEAKTTFLANMSHDIRTPMNAIVGLTAIAGAHVTDAERVKSCLSQITLSSRHLLGLINEVLDMSRIESGRISLNEEDFSLPDLVDNLLLLVKGDMAQHRHQFEVHISRLQHEKVQGDSLRIQQIFTNLVGNAIKYTPDGGRIIFSIEEKPTHHRNVGCYEFSVEDNGMGMTPEFLQKIFLPFTRADETRTSRIPGTGLGMAITKTLVDMMNGTIRVESEPGKGSRFTVTIFLKLQPDTAPSVEKLADLPVLVVDDDRQICTSTAELLTEIGLRSEWADSGEEAVQRVAQRHAEANDFFAVIVDWKMPGMGGLETVREIRRIVGRHVTVLIMSAYEFGDIADEAREAGVDGFISKPLFKSKLVSTLSSFASPGEGVPPATTVDTARINCRGKTILLVEDNEINREVACEILTMTGAAVECAENGREAIEKVSSRPDGYYALVFMDIQMPEMNGYEATAAIRSLKTPYARTIPIVAMTANAFAEDVVLARNAGMNEHIAKPIDLGQLNAVLKRWITG